MMRSERKLSTTNVLTDVLCTRTWPTIALALLLTGCSGGKIPFVHRIDIQQGNVLTQAQLAQLEAGMEKRKVRFVLGTPLVTDTFNQDRWDYYYSFEEGSGDRVQRIVSVYFEDERLVRVSGDVKTARGPIVVPPRRDEVVKVPEGLVDDGLLAALTPDFLSDRPKRIKPKDEAEDVAGVEQAVSEGGAPTDAPEVLLSEAETRELAAVLSDFGRREADAADTAAPESSEESGVLSEFARRLGISAPTGDAQDLSGGN